ncbi:MULTISPECIES: hypothetical protein [unclassified Nocardia]|uniref:hypothetical protein n=1 Tax=unclassified Nocardia TaxID=2637762 RepID=UPI002E1FF6C3|nr:hypothetical protein OHA42_33215 [Nocardia sp. NBC_01009]
MVLIAPTVLIGWITMELTVRRLVVRSSIVAALGLGSIVVAAPQAVAEAPCPDGTARLFFTNETNTCQGGGTVSFDGSPAISKVCSVGRVNVIVDATIKTGKTKTATRHLDLSNGQCGRIEIAGQLNATVTINPS